MNKLNLDFKGSDLFISRLKDVYKTQPFFVGGCVRDFLLNKDPKDIDIVIPHISIDLLINELSDFGKCDLVGKSFGVIKFKPFDSNVEYDVAVPRKEKSVGDLHTDFEIEYNTSITLKEDLSRRDFTINAIAMDLGGNFVDPLNGIRDLVSKQIKITNKNSFKDDPLRMLRALQFACRFNFNLEEDTLKSICKNASLIKHITPERVTIEFRKALQGSVGMFQALLYDTGLMKKIFPEVEFSYWFGFNRDDIKTLAEMMLFFNIPVDTKSLSLTIGDKKELLGLLSIYNRGIEFSPSYINETHFRIFKALQKCPQLINSNVFVDINRYRMAGYPRSYKDLDIDGNDLIKLGLAGSEIGECLDQLVISILYGKCINFNNKLTKQAKKIAKKIIKNRKHEKSI